MRDFDRKTMAVINRIHEAWKSKAPLSEYATVRNLILAERNRLTIHVSTLSTVVRMVMDAYSPSGSRSDPAWEDFFNLAKSLDQHEVSTPTSPSKKRKTEHNERHRLRNLAITTALWSADVVEYYGWSNAACGQMGLIKACAVHYPNFEQDFCPRLNGVLLNRHCEALEQCKGKCLNEAPLQPHRDFDLDLLSISPLDPLVEWQWITNTDGMVVLGSSSMMLRDIRPSHFPMYLLEKDRFGMLRPRTKSTPSTVAEQSAREVSYDERSSLQIGSEDWLMSSHECDRPVDSIGQHTTAISLADSHAWCSIDSNTPINATGTPDSHASSAGQCYVFTPGAPSLSSCSSVLGTGCVRESQFASFSALETDGFDTTMTPIGSPNSAIGCTGRLRLSEVQATSMRGDCVQTLSADLVTTQLDSSICDTFTQAQTPILLDQLYPGYSCLATARSTDVAERAGAFDDLGFASLDDARRIQKGQGVPLCSEEGHLATAARSPMASSTSTASRWSIEEKLRDRYHSQMGSYLVEYSKHLAVGTRREDGPLWLTANDTWASTWTPSSELGPGSVDDEARADVVYYTSENFITAAKGGNVFRKPVVIKESFNDAGMHCMTDLQALFHDLSIQEPRASLSHDGLTATEVGRDKVTAVLNLTKSHRPRFTMLNRFRVLDALGESILRKNEMDPETREAAANASQGFNTFGRRGTHHTPDISADCGKWTRVLQGTRYWTFVPEPELASHWKSLMASDGKWTLGGYDRLVALEKDDVLFIPPGIRILHTDHWPTDCLLEGGPVWDSHSLTETLQCAAWIRSIHRTKSHTELYHLADLVKGLSVMVTERPDRFDDRMTPDFLTRVLDTVSTSKSVGEQPSK